MPSKDAICATSSRSDMVGAGSADGGGRVELVTTQVNSPRIAHGGRAGQTASLLRGVREWVVSPSPVIMTAHRTFVSGVRGPASRNCVP